MSTLGERLRKRRELLGFTQENLGEQVGKDQKQIWQYETGRTLPSATVIAEIASVLQTTTDYLLGLTDYPDRPLRGLGDLSSLEREAIELLRGANKVTRDKMFRVLKDLA